MSDKLTDLHTSQSRRHSGQTESLCAYRDHNSRASKLHRHTHWQRTWATSRKRSPQIWFHAVFLGSAENHTGDKHTVSCWLPLGDQNECCIGSVTETLKAMEAELDDMTPALNVCLPFPGGRLGGLKQIHYSLYLKPQKWCQTILHYHSTTSTFNPRLIISLSTKQHIHYFNLISPTCLLGKFSSITKSHTTDYECDESPVKGWGWGINSAHL